VAGIVKLPGLDLGDLELVVEVGGQEAGHADEAAEAVTM
jgi:hypothetical protein